MLQQSAGKRIRKESKNGNCLARMPETFFSS
jgi:hypothetical protein